jgi:hypothetical protein
MRRRTLAIAGALAIFAIAAFVHLRDQRSESSSTAAQPATAAHHAPAAAPQPAPAPVAPRRSVGSTPASFAAQATDAGAADPQLAGAIISMGQSFALAEAIARNAANAGKYIDKFCAESAQQPDLPPAGTRADAAAFMAPRMDYEKPLDEPPGSLHLPDELRMRLYGAGWLDKVTDADLQRDFSWLTELQQFDHWSLLGAGRLRDYVPTDAPHASIPSYASLLAWAKLRYALGVRRGDLPVAQTEVRHLADLMRTQGILLGEMCAIYLYKLEAQAGAPGALDPDQLGRRRELDFAALAFAYPGVDPAIVRRAMSCATAPCTAMVEAVVMNRSLSGAAGSDNLAVLGELSSARGCDSDLFARFKTTREYATDEALGELADDLPQAIPKRFGPLQGQP